MVYCLPWSLLHLRVGTIFGWRVTQLVLFKFLRIMTLFLSDCEIDGSIVSILVFRKSALIFTVKVIVVRVS